MKVFCQECRVTFDEDTHASRCPHRLKADTTAVIRRDGVIRYCGDAQAIEEFLTAPEKGDPSPAHGMVVAYASKAGLRGIEDRVYFEHGAMVQTETGQRLTAREAARVRARRAWRRFWRRVAVIILRRFAGMKEERDGDD